MPAQAGIQVMDSVRHTVGKRYPGLSEWTLVFTEVTKKLDSRFRGNDTRERQPTLA